MKKKPLNNTTSGNSLCFVQFLHPGTEHEPDKRCPDFINWNREDHKRKFLKQIGCYIDNKGKKVENKEIMFWGEWEPQSSVIEICNPKQVRQDPMYIYEPHYDLNKTKKDNDFSEGCKAGKLQNTDPFVFGDRFFYGICLQDNKPSLRKLEKGSVILFGSHLNIFIVDTVFVVGNYIDYYATEDGLIHLKKKLLKKPFNFSENYIGKYFKISLCRFMESLESKKDKKDIIYRLYVGATYKHPYKEMYSYFPCKPYIKCTQGFPRPKIILKNRISQTLTQGVKGTKTAIDIKKAKKLWDCVKNQILRKKLMLGIRAEMPLLKKQYEGNYAYRE